MPNPEGLELVKGISITHELEIVHASFNIMCQSQGLPLISASYRRLQPRHLQLLANTLLNALLLALPTNSPVRDSLSVLALSILSDSGAVGRAEPLIVAALAHKPVHTLIWELVFREIGSIKKTTPDQPVGPLGEAPTRAPTVPQGPPNTNHAESEQAVQQRRELVQKEVFKEIQGCTYWDVGGFYERYFEAKEWASRAEDLFALLRNQHVNNIWSLLGESPDPSRMSEWLLLLQKNVPLTERRSYWEISLPSELTAGDEQRRVDLCVKRKTKKPSMVSIVEWKDIAVIGQLTAFHEGGVKTRLVHLACYARHLFEFQPTRRYLHAFTICGRRMELWVFDRSGCYSPGAFDIHKHPKRFVQVLAGYIMMSEDDLGLDTFMQLDGGSRFINIREQGGEVKMLHLFPHLFDHRQALVSRATTCLLAMHPDSNGYELVAKFSWPSSKQRNEGDVLTVAQQRGVEGIVKLAGHCEITTINDMRKGMTFGKRYTFGDTASGVPSSSQALAPSRPLASKRNRTSEDPANHSKKPKPNDEDLNPREPKSPLEMVMAMRDAIKAHQSLYYKGRLLHRDISQGNIIITDVHKTGFWGMLIDFDLVKELDNGPVEAGVRTGTMDFMAIQVLRSTAAPTYRHDLESFLYVLLWLCITRGWVFVGRKSPVALSELQGWRAANSYGHLARNKQANMDKHCFEDVLQEFPVEFERIKPLCRSLRSILFPIREDALFVGTPPDPNSLYGPMLEAFHEAIAGADPGAH
ncbi:hypothetical protein J3F83DRAFT_768986 [Trichoderma novae-zelandiae]